MQHQIKKQKIKTVQTQRDKPNFPLYKTVRIIEVGIVLSMPSPLPPPRQSSINITIIIIIVIESLSSSSPSS